jgi:hypothetical protein
MTMKYVAAEWNGHSSDDWRHFEQLSLLVAIRQRHLSYNGRQFLIPDHYKMAT